MMTQQEEEFVHLVSCIQNLNNAWLILQEIRHHTESPRLVNAAFQFALIEYAKPYTTSRGTVQNHRLDEKYIPAEHLELHARILQARHQIHAHSDLTVMDAKLYVTDTPNGKIAGHSQNIIHGTEEMRNLDSIIDLIEQTLDSMYEEEKRLEQRLPANA